MFIQFKKSKTKRLAAGEPHLSLEVIPTALTMHAGRRKKILTYRGKREIIEGKD